MKLIKLALVVGIVALPASAAFNAWAEGAPPFVRSIDDVIRTAPGPRLAPAPRRFRLAVIPVEFPDRRHDARFTPSDIETLLFSRGKYVDRSPSGEPVFGSVADFYAENSCDHFSLEGRVFDWVALGRERSYFEKLPKWLQPLGYLRFFPAALSALEAREGRKALDGFDGVAFVIAGSQAAPGTLLWPHSAALPWHGRFLRYYLVNEKEEERFTAIGVHCHEFGHVLGILDKYGSGGPHAGIGIWCTMAVGHRGDRANGNRRPLHLCAWCKARLGWLVPATVDPRVEQTVRLRGIEGRDGEAVKVLVDPSGSEYFLLENRRRAGFDRGIPGTGLLIWHVGELGQSLRNRVFGYSIDIEEAHGDETRAGPHHDLEHVPWPIPEKDAFTPWTHPDSTSWNLSSLPVAITSIRAEGDDIVFTLGEKVPTPPDALVW